MSDGKTAPSAAAAERITNMPDCSILLAGQPNRESYETANGPRDDASWTAHSKRLASPGKAGCAKKRKVSQKCKILFNIIFETFSILKPSLVSCHNLLFTLLTIHVNEKLRT